MPVMTPVRHLEGVRACGRAADAFETVDWRPPSATRFDTRVANDPATPQPTSREAIARLPAWVKVVAGCVVAALMGALAGGALAL